MNTEKQIAGGNASVIVYGPQGCGKTLHGAQLARHFGVRHWGDLDEMDVRAFKYQVPARDYLLLCADHPQRYVTPPAGVRILAFKDVIGPAGVTLGAGSLQIATGDAR